MVEKEALFAGKDLFGVTDPLGKVLGLTPKSIGVQIILFAWNSILTFIDTVLNTILQQLNSLKEIDVSLHNDFKIVMFVGFQTRKEAMNFLC